ncbi:MAG: helix-turn-helix domain-containing protein [Clostridiales bacterium]|nr:helix-turn-helix domain-containing protein [Clostridiales bacterium]
MEISLPLLLERSCLKKDEYTLIQFFEEDKFTGVQLLPDNQSQCKDSLLYLVQNGETSALQVPDHAGLILLAEKDFVCPENIRCNLLVIHKNSSSKELFNHFFNIFLELQHQAELFCQAACSQSPLQKMAEFFYDILGNPAYIIDSSFKVLAIDCRNHMRELSVVWKRLEDEGYLSYDLVANLIESRELAFMESGADADLIVSHFFYTPFVNYNLRKGSHFLGHLFIVGMLKKITPGDIELVTYFGKLVAQVAASNVKYQNERGRYYEYFMTDIFKGKLTDMVRIEQQMNGLHYNPDQRYLVIAADPADHQELVVERLMSQIERLRGGKPVYIDGHVASLIPLRQNDTIEGLKDQLEEMASQLDFRAGVSDVFEGYRRIHEYYRQAEYALKALRQADAGSRVCPYGIFSLEHLMQMLSSLDESGIFFLDNLKCLEEYDNKYHTELTTTLKVYLENERNVIRTAKQLFIHRNTLSYRIQKICELCDLNFDIPEVRLRVYLSLCKNGS